MQMNFTIRYLYVNLLQKRDIIEQGIIKFKDKDVLLAKICLVNELPMQYYIRNLVTC